MCGARGLRGGRGFTLIEVVTAFAVLALATAVAVPAFLRLVREDDLTRATRRVESLFRIARDSAISGGAPVTVVVDSVSGRVWLDAAGAPAGPPAGPPAAEAAAPALGPGATAGTSLGLPGTVTLHVPAARARFTFAPSGRAFGEHLLLRSPLGSRVVHLDPWTGDVVVR